MEQAKSKFEISLEDGPHRELASITGKWKGTVRTWFEPGKLADESPISGEIRTILGGRFLLHQYQGSMMEKPLEGMAIIGYSFEQEKYQTAWIDSFHMGTGILFSEGTAIENGHSVLGSYGGSDIPEPWGWRTELAVIGTDELTITAYNIAPTGEEAKATEIIYHRKN